MTNDNKIGVYDSGVGGLTVLSELVKIMPDEKFIYFGDLKNLPYGEKTEEELIKIGSKIFDFFEKQKVKAVVMACNTTSALLYDKIKDKYPFKIYPIIQTVAKYIAQQNIKNIGIFATKATINSHAYRNEILKYNPEMKVFEQACPDWVRIVETKNFCEENIEIIKNDLDRMITNNPQKIVLGCTHYPYLTKILGKYQTNSMFINPAEKFSKLIFEDLTKKDLLSKNKKAEQTFYVSQNPEQFIVSAEMFYKIKDTPVLIDLK